MAACGPCSLLRLIVESGNPWVYGLDVMVSRVVWYQQGYVRFVSRVSGNGTCLLVCVLGFAS